MITAQSRLGEVTAQSRRGHSSVTARSQLSHGEVTAQSRHLQYDHDSVTIRSQLNHGPGHGSVTASCDHFGHRELTVSSHAGNFFSHGRIYMFWLVLFVSPVIPVLILSHQGRVTHIYVYILGNHYFRHWHVADKPLLKTDLLLFGLVRANILHILFIKMNWHCRMQNGGHLFRSQSFYSTICWRVVFLEVNNISSCWPSVSDMTKICEIDHH